MGLDNRPHKYPCITEGTAIRDSQQRVDCAATIDAGGCPYTRDYEAAGAPAGRVYGLFATPCWVRGKVGEFILDDLIKAGYEPPPKGFYGLDEPDEGQPNLSPEQCRVLADWMADHAEAYSHVLAAELQAEGVEADRSAEALTEAGQTYYYLVWWLRWVSTAGGGADAWW